MTASGQVRSGLGRGALRLQVRQGVDCLAPEDLGQLGAITSGPEFGIQTGACLGGRGVTATQQRVLEGVQVLACSLAAGGAARADTYPSRPIQFVIPFTAGNAIDGWHNTTVPSNF